MFSIPCNNKIWDRLQKYFNYCSKNSENYLISDYWKKRKQDFDYNFENGIVHIADPGLYVEKQFEDNKYFPNKNLFQELFKILAANILEFVELRSPPIDKIQKKLKYLLAKNSETYHKNQLVNLYENKYKPRLQVEERLLTEMFGVYTLTKQADIAFLLISHLGTRRKVNVLEVGAGVAILSYLLYRKLNLLRYDIIDLSFVIPNAFLLLSYLAPDAIITIPGEDDNKKAVFRFFLPDSYPENEADIDIGINVTSFQEMNQKIVRDYFDLFQKVIHQEGYIFCMNRSEKTFGNDIQRFSDYPWPDNFETLLDEDDIISYCSGPTTRHERRLLRRYT